MTSIKNLLPEKIEYYFSKLAYPDNCVEGYNKAIDLCESKLKEAFKKGIIRWGKDLEIGKTIPVFDVVSKFIRDEIDGKKLSDYELKGKILHISFLFGIPVYGNNSRKDKRK